MRTIIPSTAWLQTQTYTVYYTTSNGTSTSVNITTGNCEALVPGCTDALAVNYSPSANFDDGSCEFPCTDVTFSITTDCWGYESSWNIINADGNTVVTIPFNTYGNNQTYTWTGCLEWGCYTFNILDSFGDGLAGIASGCGQDGNYTMVDDQGNTLFQMGAPNFGSGTNHVFCVPVDLPGCTDVAACNYNSLATIDNGSCTYPDGCTDPAACNYNQRLLAMMVHVRLPSAVPTLKHATSILRPRVTAVVNTKAAPRASVISTTMASERLPIC